MTPANVNGKSIIITGAASGIGRATSRLLSTRGARLTLVDRNEEALEQVRAEIAGSGGEVVSALADVSREDEVAAYVAAADQAYGRIDGFYNNAGIEGAVGPLTELSTADWQRVIAVNLTGIFLGLRHVIPVMEAQGGGAIVCTGSIASARGLPDTVAYNAAKHGVIGLVKTAVAESTGRGVRVNAVLPGMVATPMLRSLTSHLSPDIDPDEGVEQIGRLTAPIGRTAQPEDVARVVAFLLSDDAGYVSGAEVPVDGGTLAVLSNKQ